MKRDLRVLAAAGSLSLALAATDAAFAQKADGILKLGHFDSPASISMLEESNQAVNRPMSGVFNNLVMYKQDVPQNSMKSIVPELATSWSWNEEGTELTFALPRRRRILVPICLPSSASAGWWHRRHCSGTSNGTTASHSRLRTSNAPSIC